MRRRFFRAARADNQTEEGKGRLLWPGAGILALDWMKIQGDDFGKGRARIRRWDRRVERQFPRIRSPRLSLRAKQAQRPPQPMASF
jgi:hypothetical protein